MVKKDIEDSPDKYEKGNRQYLLYKKPSINF